MSRIQFFSSNDGSVSLRTTSLPASSFIYLFSVLWNHFCFFVRPLRFNLLYFCFCDQILFLRWCRTTKSKKGERKWKRWRREDIVVRGKEREKREHCYTSCVFIEILHIAIRYRFSFGFNRRVCVKWCPRPRPSIWRRLFKHNSEFPAPPSDSGH